MMRTKSRVLLAGIVNGSVVAFTPVWWPWLFGTSSGTTVRPDTSWRLPPEYAMAACIGMFVCLGTLGWCESYLSGRTRLRLGRVALIALVPALLVAAEMVLQPSLSMALYIATYALLAFLAVFAVGVVFAVVALAVLHLTGPVPEVHPSDEA